MTVKNFCLFFLLGCLSIVSVQGQTPGGVSAEARVRATDSVAFEQGRLRIWCETTRFVYEDNGADSLLPSLNCQSWESLQAAMNRTDGSLGVMRLMNSVDKPSIYQGYASTEAKLQKLVGEISSRLKQSPSRRTNAARLNSVDSLQRQLMLIVRQTDPAGAAAAIDQDQFQSAENDEAAEYETIYPPSDDVPTVSYAALPWNEILQWLLLLILTVLVAWKLRAYEKRHQHMKREFRTLEKQVNELLITSMQSAPSSVSKKGLSEADVRALLKDELQRTKNSSPAAAAPTPVSTAAATTQAQAAKPQKAEAAAVSAAPTAPPPPAPAAPREKETEGGIFYDKMPFRGGFHQHELSRERQRDSLYTIRIDSEQATEADYWVTEEPEIQRYAMQNGMSFFEEGCDFSEVEENPSRVVNEQKGKLRKEGSVWKIVQKAKVRFE